MSSSVSGNPSPLTYPDASQAAAASQVQTETAPAPGAATQTGPVPAVPSASLMGAMMDSLRRLMPDMSMENMQVALLKVMTTLKETIGETEKAQIDVDSAAKRLALQDKQNKINDSEAKQKEAAETRSHLSVWDKIKVAFQYVGAIAALIGGVLALATSWFTGPAGVVAGVLLITAGILLLGMAADATYTAVQTEKTGKPGLGMVGEIHKAVLMKDGMSAEDAYKAGLKADNISRIVCTAVAGALMLGAAIAGGVSAFQLGFAVMRAVQGGVGVGTNVVAAGASAASASGDIANAVGKRDATDLDAGAKEDQASAKIMEALVAFLEDMIAIIMSRMKGTAESFEGNLDALVQSVKDSGETYGRVGLKM